MISSRRLFLKHLAKIFDIGVVIGSFFFATIVIFSPSGFLTLGELLAIPITLGNCLLFASLLIVSHEIFALCGLYVSKRLTRPAVEMVEVCKATVSASAFLFLCARGLHITTVTIDFALLFWACCTIIMLSGRLVGRALLLQMRRKGRNSRFVLVVGTNKRAIEFANQIGRRPELGYRIVGFVDDEWDGLTLFEQSGYQRACAISGLGDFLRHNVVDEAAIYLPLRSYYEHAVQLISLCEHHGIAVRVDSQVFNLRNSQGPYANLNDEHHAASSWAMWPLLAKRAVDSILTVIALVVFAPLLLATAVLVKMTSSGPVFFRQTRMGLNKRQFQIFKFRTMVERAEEMQHTLLSQNEMSGPVFKIREDPRVTSVGRFLRKTSIDELPQLLNVLKGDMSLVGPRAMSLRDYRLFEHDWHCRRFSVKPGITCLWQVNGRNAVSFEHWMELDMQYIDKWSLWLDFKILAQTVPAVLKGTGAA